MPKGKGYPKKTTSTTTVKPKKKKSSLQKIKDRAQKNKDALNFE